ncbi:MAG: nitroreductase family protein [Thermoprotei archaeon]|nr:MAG: nitroreductase family protein [Thermoprotei archaeon]
MSSRSDFDVLANIVKTRRTIRSFRDEDVPKELIEKILDIARWSPSGSNAQEWRFIVVTNRDLLKAMKMFSPGWLGDSPAAIVICADREWAYKVAGILGRDVMYLIDAGIVMQTIALLAHTLGLGTNIILSFSKEALRELLQIPKNWDIVAIIALGYPKEIPKPPPRLPLTKLMIWR